MEMPSFLLMACPQRTSFPPFLYSVLLFSCDSIATGNKQTLGIPDIRERAIAFHHQYYMASNMQLVILSGYAYPQMREYVESLFSSMPTCDVTLPTISVCDDDGQ